MTTRRNFLQTMAAAGGAIGLGLAVQSAAADPGERAGRPLRILILGGTGFIGPYQVEYALARGHRVTLFNRGKTRPDLFRGEVEQLIGDRNGDLKALEGRTWDVVVDNPTSLPVWVRDAGKVLAGHAEQYIFISTISVYADTTKPGIDESAAVAQYAGENAMAETMETLRANMELYGPLKALSEQEAERWFPGKTTVVRPGLIVGPGDPTDRFSYWPLRVDRGGEVLAPGDPGDPVQIIDARDLSEFVIRLAESRTDGTFNATGPESRLGIAEMLYGLRAVTTGPISFTWVPADFLSAHGAQPWSDLPVWVPPIEDMMGFAQIDISRALAAGMTFRPLAVTARDTIDWYAGLDDKRRAAPMRAGLTPERERELLAAWKARAAGGAAG